VRRDIEVRPEPSSAGSGSARGALRRLRKGPSRGKHPLQTSAATGRCASQVGPLARAAMAFLNKALGASPGKIANLFATLWGLDITPGGVSHAIQSIGAIGAIGRSCRGDDQAIVRKIKSSRPRHLR
jgi:hypothetical protein